MNDTVGVSNDTWQWYREVIRSWLEDPGVHVFEGLNMTALKMDEAYMVGSSEINVGVYSVSDDCFRVSLIFTIKRNSLLSRNVLLNISKYGLLCKLRSCLKYY